jgi:hypothetical protein
VVWVQLIFELYYFLGKWGQVTRERSLMVLGIMKLFGLTMFGETTTQTPTLEALLV